MSNVRDSLIVNIGLLEETELLDVELQDDFVGAQGLDSGRLEVDEEVLFDGTADDPVAGDGGEAQLERAPGGTVAPAARVLPLHVVELGDECAVDTVEDLDVREYELAEVVRVGRADERVVDARAEAVVVEVGQIEHDMVARGLKEGQVLPHVPAQSLLRLDSNAAVRREHDELGLCKAISEPSYLQQLEVRTVDAENHHLDQVPGGQVADLLVASIDVGAENGSHEHQFKVFEPDVLGPVARASANFGVHCRR